MTSDLETRMNNVEEEMDEIRNTVAKNTEGIHSLQKSLAKLEAQVQMLVTQLQSTNNLMVSSVNYYKSIIQNVLDSNEKLNNTLNKIAQQAMNNQTEISRSRDKYQVEMVKNKDRIIGEALKYLMYISVISVSALGGLKIVGWI